MQTLTASTALRRAKALNMAWNSTRQSHSLVGKVQGYVDPIFLVAGYKALTTWTATAQVSDGDPPDFADCTLDSARMLFEAAQSLESASKQPAQEQSAKPTIAAPETAIEPSEPAAAATPVQNGAAVS